MGKQLVLAEKPSVGRDIARVLKCTNRSKAYIEGDKYIVTWAMGHLVQLASPERYDKAYTNWELSALPMIPEHFKLEIMGRTAHQYKQIKYLLGRKDVDGVIIATDAGREGELVARWILKNAGSKKPVKRLWISSVTDKAISNGFKNLKDGKEYLNLYQSAVARAEADWLVGLNASRALTCKYNESLSCGRVQTPTLSIIHNREEQIGRFKPENIYHIKATIGNFKFTLVRGDNVWRTKDKQEAELLISGLKGQRLVVSGTAKKTKKKYADKLYDLTTLQRDADATFGFSAKETLRLMQGLYEQHKLLTYPRTDARYISEDIVETLDERLRSIQVGPYKSYVAKVLKQGIKTSKHFVDNSKVSDHHAIIPTEEVVDLKTLSANEYKIYDMVVRRFLAVMMPPAEYGVYTIEGTIGKQAFRVKEEHCIVSGFKALYGESPNKAMTETLGTGDILPVQQVSLESTLTSPPERFTEGLLLYAMEHPAKYMDAGNQVMAQSLKDSGGLGTVATRADIIEKLLNNMYIEKRGKHLYMTKKGKQLLKLVPASLRTPELTASWELKLSGIAKGMIKRRTFIDEMVKYTKEVVQTIKTNEITYRHETTVSEKCPQCGESMFSKTSKHGKSVVCSDRSCGYKKTITKTTNARCPNCHKKLNLVGEGDGRKFVCTCGYKEKMASFDKRKKEKKQQMGKREVNKYLGKQNKQEAFNNPFVDLLNKIDD